MNNFPKFPMPSAMRHDFSRVPHADMQRSSFRRPHAYKTTFNAGYLIPILTDEVLPGDTFRVNLSSVARLNTPLFPLMDNMYMDYFFFFVPNRLLWTNWERFMGAQDNPDDSTDYLVPVIENSEGDGSFDELTLPDYFGLPIGVPNMSVNALHFRAYNLIWNTWFRDQNLQDSVTVDIDDGPDDIADYVLLKRGKRHDYFTSCLPWPQKGPGVELPLGSVAPVITGDERTFDTAEDEMLWWDPATGNHPGALGTLGYNAAGELIKTGAGAVDNGALVPSNLWADLGDATASTINSLREAFQLQKLMERDARGGTRYTEIVQSHFLVTSPDARLQRPEYLGGGSRPIIVEPVASSNINIANELSLGDLGGVGYQATNNIGFSKSFTEHGVIIGLVSVRADLTYQNGINRMWLRQTKYDFYWPALAHLGEQEVLNKEIYATGVAEDDDDVFGYQERWAEYRYKPSLVTGQMRSDNSLPLDAWHLSQDFDSCPELGDTFIQEDPPIDRVVAVDTEPHFLFDGFFDITCTRSMPMYSVPGLIDHF